MPERYRQLPDGTWLDTVTDTVAAPLEDAPRASATAGPTVPRSFKRYPSPPDGPGRSVFMPSSPDPLAQPLQGLHGNYGAIPGQWKTHMRGGRNYASLGEWSVPRKMVAVVAVVGVAAATVWFQQRKKRKKIKGAD